MSTATLTSKGQTTIPKDIRDALSLKTQDKLQFTLLADGTTVMRVKRRSILELAGSLYDEQRDPISVEAMNPWK